MIITVSVWFLERCGVRGMALQWFQSYSYNREQIRRLNFVVSDGKEIRCGVPQGSNLGPSLFQIYINDLPNCLQTTTASMFADDTNLSCTGKIFTDTECKMNKALENI